MGARSIGSEPSPDVRHIAAYRQRPDLLDERAATADDRRHLDLELGGKRSLITGGSDGIGWLCRGALTSEGPHVALVGRASRGHRLRSRSLDAPTGRIFALVADGSDDQSVRAMVRRRIRTWVGLTFLVNAAARQAGAGQNGHLPNCPMTPCATHSRQGCWATLVRAQSHRS
jgi:NAD(P)-dependent dehydrogenase (short-subunit alcohol dehydrogenase family)